MIKMINRPFQPTLCSLACVSVLAIFVVAFAGGCNRNPYSTVSGTVTFKGQPVPSGEVRFTPDSRKGNKGPAVVAIIKNGAYTTPEGKGIVGGPYQIRIMGYEKPEASDDPTASDFGDNLFETQNQWVDLPKKDCEHNIAIE